MKTLALLVALFAVADESLVAIAKQSKEKRKKSTTRVITNEDVRKSKGKIQTTNVAETPVEKQPTLMEKHEAARAAEAAAAAHKAKWEKIVADLEKELIAVEQSYYGENDLNKRDTEIVRRFNEVKKKLDEARAQLQ